MLAFALALPVAARAEVITVNSTADEVVLHPGTGSCLTAAGKCTLRAAIEESNLAGTSTNEINFDGSVFSGQASGTIALGGGLPPITEPVRINGGRCQAESGVPGPCVAINGTNSSAALSIESDETTVENLQILNAAVGVEVAAAKEFELLGNWFGGGAHSGPLGGGDGTGVLVGPGSGGGVVGGKESGEGNLFLSGGTGLYIHGASHVKVLGNQFGFAPDGTFLEREFLVDIQVTSAPNAGYEAVGNEIGTTLSKAAFATPACDGGCNLLSGAEYTLDLFSLGSAYGEDGPPVETTIAGNDVGLNPAGTETVSPTGGIGRDGPKTVIGGPDARDGNRIDGVWDAISGSGPELTVANNLIGVDYSGSEILGPAHEGIAVYSGSENPALEAVVVENEVVVEGGRGISNSGMGATIAGNEVVGAQIGIYTQDDQGLQGNLIEANSVEDSSEEGIYVEDSDNEVLGNKVIGSRYDDITVAGQQPAGATGNVVGGETEASENELSLSGGPAVGISAREGTENEVARNHGFENEGRFISIRGVEEYEPVGPNGGIEPPEFSAATEISASGSGAEPGALVRVFRKGSAEEGELESFLGQATVTANGSWTVTYPAIPPGTNVAATQTKAGGTSELAMAATPGPAKGGTEVGGGGAGGGGGGVTIHPIERLETNLPQAKIVKAPRRKTRSRNVRFWFRSDETGSSFQCKLDRQPFRSCKSPIDYRGLKPGKYVFEVRAIDPAGHVDPNPAQRRFTVLPLRR